MLSVSGGTFLRAIGSGKSESLDLAGQTPRRSAFPAGARCFPPPVAIPPSYGSPFFPQKNTPDPTTQRRRQQPPGAFRTISVETFRPSPMPKRRRDGGREGGVAESGCRRPRGCRFCTFRCLLESQRSRRRRRHRAEITVCLPSPFFLRALARISRIAVKQNNSLNIYVV